jgi:hypothetical protein
MGHNPSASFTPAVLPAGMAITRNDIACLNAIPMTIYPAYPYYYDLSDKHEY